MIKESWKQTFASQADFISMAILRSHPASVNVCGQGSSARTRALEILTKSIIFSRIRISIFLNQIN